MQEIKGQRVTTAVSSFDTVVPFLFTYNPVL